MSRLGKETVIALAVVLSALRGQAAEGRGQSDDEVVDEIASFFKGFIGAAGFEVVEKAEAAE